MSAVVCVDDSRIITTPNILSLSRLALIKVAFPLWKKFGSQPLSNGKRKRLKASKRDYLIGIVVQKKLSMPTLLRKKVISAVHGLEREIFLWKQDHSDLRYENCINFYWRSDGSIDRVKTAQQLVLNENIDIRKRFETACEYCLEESIFTLYAEMEATRKMIFFWHGLVPFWVERMHPNSQIPWTKAIVEYLASNRYLNVEPKVACISFFPLLQPADRKKFLSFFTFPRLDDLRLCLYSMTREEQEQMLPICTIRLLSFYAEWPLRSLFLETVEKLWNYIDEFSFCKLLNSIFDRKRIREDFYTYEVVRELLDMSPAHFREMARYEINQKVFRNLVSDTEWEKNWIRL